jgi:hypothetical protein
MAQELLTRFNSVGSDRPGYMLSLEAKRSNPGGYQMQLSEWDCLGEDALQ